MQFLLCALLRARGVKVRVCLPILRPEDQHVRHRRETVSFLYNSVKRARCVRADAGRNTVVRRVARSERVEGKIDTKVSPVQMSPKCRRKSRHMSYESDTRSLCVRDRNSRRSLFAVFVAAENRRNLSNKVTEGKTCVHESVNIESEIIRDRVARVSKSEDLYAGAGDLTV